MLNELGFTRKQLTATVVYIFKGMTNKEFRAFFDDGIAAKRAIDSSGYLLLNCKLYLWAYYQGAKPRARDYKVTPEDAKFLRSVDLSFCSTPYKVWGLDEFRLAVEQQVWSADLSVYMGKFISRKLMFLRSYGLSRSDIVTEMQTDALYSIYRVFPALKSDLHIRNVAKRSVKNTGQSLIYKYTRKSRQQLYLDEQGNWQHVNVPYEAAVKHGLVDHGQYDGFDVTWYMGKLHKAYGKCTPRARRFISLLLGEPDKEFSRFLGRRNEVAFSTLEFAHYCELVQAYLGITERQKLRFFEKVRRAV